MTVGVVRGDARHLPIPDESVDLIVTSPPYFGLRDYGADAELGSERTPEEFVAALLACTAEMRRVLRRRGSMFVNLGDCYSGYNANRGDGQLQTNVGQSRPALARGLSSGGGIPNKSLMLIPERYRIGCVDQLALVARAVIIWRKTPSMPAGRIRDRVRTVHEDWVHLTKSDRYHHNAAALRELGGGQMPPSVWSAPVASALDAQHPAMFPMEWPRRIITGWCPPGGVVLDPFGGTGTTALVGDAHGRTVLTVDTSADYCKVAVDRLRDPAQRARARLAPRRLRRPRHPAVPDQGALFEVNPR